MIQENSGNTPITGNVPADTNSIARKKLKQAFRQTIRMACLRLGATWPNPPVGCAILDKDGNILSMATHRHAGEAHAETVAIETLKRWNLTEQAACLLVTLEPCNHHGKTPPCVEALLKTNIPEIWIGTPDPNNTASGGADRLEQAGKKIIRLWKINDPYFDDIIEDCQALITPFKTRLSLKRPWIIAKQALDENGGMIPPKGQKTFTSQAALEISHLLRRSSGAIITGRGTILADKPLFNIRHITDFDTAPERWIIACGQEKLPLNWVEGRMQAGFHFLHVNHPHEAAEALGKTGVEMALIEAGPQLLSAFQKAGLVDEILQIHKGSAQDNLQWEKYAPAPSPLLLLEKYSPDWPRGLPLKNKKAIHVASDIFHPSRLALDEKILTLRLKRFFSKIMRKN